MGLIDYTNYLVHQETDSVVSAGADFEKTQETAGGAELVTLVEFVTLFGEARPSLSSFSTLLYEIREYYQEKDAWKTIQMTPEVDKEAEV
jgi:hypothetical protein